MHGIHITRANQDDVQAVHELSITTFMETYQGTCPDEDISQFLKACFSEQAILTELKDPENYYYLAFTDGLPAGYIRLQEDYSDYPEMAKYKALELKRIYVLNKYHGWKIGATLMQCAIQLAIEKGFEAIWLGVWEKNAKALAFYRQFGFIDTLARHTFYIGKTAQEDHWMLKFI